MWGFTMITLISLVAAVCFAQSIDVRSVPNPRFAGQWSVDQAQVFTPIQKAELDGILTRINLETGAEVTLVTLPTVGQRTPKDFAVELFNTWKIGRKGSDNGLLILLVTDQRRIEAETGYGLEGTLPDVVLSRIERELIIPSLKHGHAAEGFRSGLLEIERRILQDPTALTASTARRTNPMERILLIIAGLSGLLVLASLASLIVMFRNRDPYALSQNLNRNFGALFFWQLAALTGAVGGLIVLAPDLVRMGLALAFGLLCGVLAQLARSAWSESLRVKPRACGHCGEIMVRRSAHGEKAFETEGERVEEEIGSVDYDVWTCPNQHVRKDAYVGVHANEYDQCEACGTQTRKLLKDKIVTYPGFLSNGRGERTYRCQKCRVISVESYVITQQSSSGGSSSDGGGGGGSFGGGSSGGGGAGSSY